MLKEILAAGKVTGHRTIYEVLSKLMEEVGELAQEVGIKEGFQNRKPSVDGIIGETADVVITAINLMWIADPSITKKEFNAKVNEKLDKWKKKSKAYIRTPRMKDYKIIDLDDIPDEYVTEYFYSKGRDIMYIYTITSGDSEFDDYVLKEYEDIKDGETVLIQNN